MPPHRSRRMRYLFELILLALFVLVCALIDSRASTHLDIDSHRYLELGQSLLDSRTFAYKGINDQTVIDTSRTPIFPALIAATLAVTGSKPGAILLVIWLQRLLWAGAVLYLLPAIHPSRRPLRRFTLLAKCVLLFSPVVLFHASMLLTDILYAAGLLAAFRLTIRSLAGRTPWQGIGTGLFHGLLTLLRPIHLFVPPVNVLPWLRKSPRRAVLIILLLIILPLCWMARNNSLIGSWSLTTLGGRALSLHQEQSIRQMQPDTSTATYGPEFIRALNSTTENTITAAWIIMRDHHLTDVQADKVAGAVALEAIRRFPGSFLLQSTRNLTRYFWSRVDGTSLLQLVHPAAAPRSLTLAGYLNGIWGVIMFLVLPVWLLITRVPRRLMFSRPGLAHALVTGYLLIVPALTTVTYGRFTLPLLPFIAIIYCAADLSRARRS